MPTNNATTTILVTPKPNPPSSALVLCRPEDVAEDQSLRQEFSRENSRLDDKIDECRTYLQASGLNYVAACQCIKDIADGLWEERRGADGQPLHASWKEYARRELARRLGFKSHTHVFEMLRVIEEGLVPDIEKFGIKMAKLLAAAPPYTRDNLRSKREAGAGTREIEHEVARMKDERHERDVAEAKASGKQPPRRRGRKPATKKTFPHDEAPAVGQSDRDDVRLDLIAEGDGALAAVTPILRAGCWRIVLYPEQGIAFLRWRAATANRAGDILVPCGSVDDAAESVATTTAAPASECEVMQ